MEVPVPLLNIHSFISVVKQQQRYSTSDLRKAAAEWEFVTLEFIISWMLLAVTFSASLRFIFSGRDLFLQLNTGDRQETGGSTISRFSPRYLITESEWWEWRWADTGLTYIGNDITGDCLELLSLTTSSLPVRTAGCRQGIDNSPGHGIPQHLPLLLPPHWQSHHRHHVGFPLRTRLRPGALDAAWDWRLSLRACLHPHHRISSDVRPFPGSRRLSQVSQIANSPDTNNFPNQNYKISPSQNGRRKPRSFR